MEGETEGEQMRGRGSERRGVGESARQAVADGKRTGQGIGVDAGITLR